MPDSFMETADGEQAPDPGNDEASENPALPPGSGSSLVLTLADLDLDDPPCDTPTMALLDAESCHCKFPFPDLQVCGRPTTKQGPYCQGHRSIIYQKGRY